MADDIEKFEDKTRVFSAREKTMWAIAYPVLVLFWKIIDQNILMASKADKASAASFEERAKHVKELCDLLEPGNDDKTNCSRKVLMRLKNQMIKFGRTGMIHESTFFLGSAFEHVKQSTATLFASLEAFPTKYLEGARLAIKRIFELLETPDDGLFFASKDSYASEVEYAFSEFIRLCEKNISALKEEHLSPLASLQEEMKGLRKDSKAMDKSVKSLGKKTNAVLYEVSEGHAFGQPLTVSDQVNEVRQRMLDEALNLVVNGGETNLRKAARQIVEKYEATRGGYNGESGIKALSEQLRRKLNERGIVAKVESRFSETTLKATTLKAETTLKTTTLKTETTLKGSGQKILACMKENTQVTIPELMRETGLSRDGVKYQLRELKLGGYLRREGGRKLGHWVLTV